MGAELAPDIAFLQDLVRRCFELVGELQLARDTGIPRATLSRWRTRPMKRLPEEHDRFLAALGGAHDVEHLRPRRLRTAEQYHGAVAVGRLYGFPHQSDAERLRLYFEYFGSSEP